LRRPPNVVAIPYEPDLSIPPPRRQVRFLKVRLRPPNIIIWLYGYNIWE
jgi:hypothetical protein